MRVATKALSREQEMLTSSSCLKDRLLVREQLERRRRLCDLEFVIVHIGGNLGEEGCRKVAFARVWQHRQNNRALRSLLRCFERGPHCAAARNTSEDALFGSEK